jgi:hypothetical protein
VNAVLASPGEGVLDPGNPYASIEPSKMFTFRKEVRPHG